MVGGTKCGKMRTVCRELTGAARTVAVQLSDTSSAQGPFFVTRTK